MKNIIDKRKLIIIGILVICIIAIFLAVYIQWFKEKSVEELRKETEEKEKNLEEYELLEQNFDTIFSNNTISQQNISNDVNKIMEEKEIVYPKYKGAIEKENQYTVDINIPYINIDSELTKTYNEEIEEVFVEKLRKIGIESRNDIYTVEYVSNIKNNILSIIIKATLKQQGGIQRVIIKTYCFDVINEKEITLQDVLKNKNINEKEVQDKITKKIKEKQNEAIALEQLGYEIYLRDYTDEMYEIENINDFYIDENGYIYIMFAYGNNNNTGEMDIIII